MKVKLMHTYIRASAFVLMVVLVAALLGACTTPPASNNTTTANANSSNANGGQTTGYIDLVGKWEGQSQGQPSTLVIRSHMSDTFTGTKTVGENQIDVAGVVNLSTREITIRETNVVKGSGYSMGSGTGVIAPNGRQMSGEWKGKGSASTFSYSK